MELPTTAQVDASLAAVLSAAKDGGASTLDMQRVQTWAKGFEVLIRAYGQGGIAQLERVFQANFEALAPHSAALAAAAGQTAGVNPKASPAKKGPQQP